MNAPELALSFQSQNPPARLIGFETEADVRNHQGENSLNAWEDYVSDACEELGIPFQQSNDSDVWLPNSGNAGADMGHLELRTPESSGPAEATATMHGLARLAGEIATQIGEMRGKPLTIFRRSATVDPATGDITTKGHHSNFLVPAEALQWDRPEDAEAARNIIETHLVTKGAFASGGIVTTDGFNIAPKSGIILQHVRETKTSRPRFGLPIARIHKGSDADGDIQTGNEFLRVEDLTSTPSTVWSDLMGAASTSLKCRVLEHPDMLQKEFRMLAALGLADPVSAFQQSAYDTTFKNKYALRNGKSASIPYIQESSADVALSVAEKLHLPDDEIWAAHAWKQAAIDLKLVATGKADLELLADRVGWAAKYNVLRRKLPQGKLDAGNVSIDALRYCLAWDRIAPKGAGQIYDERFGAGREIVTTQQIEHFMTNAPTGTRAHVRERFIKDPKLRDSVAVMEWNKIGRIHNPGHNPKKTVHTLDPYQTTMPWNLRIEDW